MSIFNDGSQTKEERNRTILAVVLSTVIVGVGFMIQNMLFPPVEQPAAQVTTTTQTQAPVPGSTIVGTTGTLQPATGVVASPVAAPAAAVAEPAQPLPAAEATYVIETDLFRATLSNAGGEIVSLQLKEHKEKDSFVDLVVPGSKGSNGISLAFGEQQAAPVRELMNAGWLDPDKKTIQFSRIFYARSEGSAELQPFTYKKTYSFKDGEYLFGMAVTLESADGRQLPLNSNGTAYTLSIGPQIGPRFDQLAKNADYRKYILEVDGKKKLETAKAGNIQVMKDKPSWAALAGKYFAFIAIPEAGNATVSYLQAQDPQIKQTNTMYLSRPVIGASSQTDKYYFYFGPRTASQLARYEYSDKNAFGLKAMRLEDATERSNLLGWLENILKFLLNICYRLVPNYGVAIILVTILIKIIFFPLTKKSSISTARMQELQPKLQELQAKYKGNTQRLNQEMAEFYKRENYNPMSGCLPMLIQFPLFIAMYNLFNNHFDLRGASFIPGWIFDLSLPESVVNFGDFRLPILGWNDIRALPIIYLASQLLYGRFTQTPQSGQNASQMKLMMYGMPIMFFFVLYDVPSGLLIYWIVSNVLTIVQQVVINDMLKKHKIKSAEMAPAAAAAAAGGMKLAGKTTVKNGGSQAAAPAAGEDIGDKVKNWLEKKAGAMGGEASQKGKPQGKPTGKNAKK